MAASISIFSSKRCFPNSINLKIDTDKGVAYIDNSMLFNVKEASLSLHHRHVLCDADGNPIFTLHKKVCL